ncbi:MAG: AMP-binding protein [Betaproteobacteria bacterium]|nr:AMP-binding protein [Betaproteobacteria bacterium]
MTGTTLPQAAGQSTIGSLFRERARLHPDRIAIEASGRSLSYGALNERVNRAAEVLSGFGIGRGDRVAILSENRAEYLELELACAKLGAMLACQNWRLAPAELKHCIRLVSPKVVVVSERHAELLARTEAGAIPTIGLGREFDERLERVGESEPETAVEPEDGLLILYTSGTTGLPKGAVVSHRAEIARALVYCVDLGIRPGDTSLGWPPFFHMAGSDPSLAALIEGGKVIVVDGFKPAEIALHVGKEQLGHLILLPGMIEPLIGELRKHAIRPKGLRLCGAMADLVPAHQIAEVTALLGAPYLNSFGSTETGIPPASVNRIPVGEVPARLSKQQNSFCEIRLVDAEDRDVPPGTPGELLFRGPTLFSGYWNAPETNTKDFRGGWFHLGDMFVRRADGSLDFVDRVKYLIKSGGENIYPAEIERVLLADARVADAVVVRRPDAKWGEVPVAIVARKDETLTSAELLARCRAELAGYKQPKDIVFVTLADLPRSTTGKIQRHEIEAWLKRRGHSLEA